MDIIQLYQDFSVDHVTEGHKHCREGWVNVECPFCIGNRGYHLGYNMNDDYFHCWRCGGKSTLFTLSTLLKLPVAKVRDLIKNYGLVLSTSAPKMNLRRQAFKLPSGVTDLNDNHIRYLQERNFDPDLLINLWQLKGTGPISKLEITNKTIDYKHRIIIPFFWDGKMVSFDSRSIVFKGHDQLRYLACPIERELIPHKEILYGKKEKWKETGICVEGPTDVWRFGISSFAVSGIKYTPMQVRNIARIFKRVFIIFDADPQAKVQATKLMSELKFRGIEAYQIDIEGDPGSMKQEDADYLVKILMK